MPALDKPARRRVARQMGVRRTLASAAHSFQTQRLQGPVRELTLKVSHRILSLKARDATVMWRPVITRATLLHEFVGTIIHFHVDFSVKIPCPFLLGSERLVYSVSSTIGSDAGVPRKGAF